MINVCSIAIFVARLDDSHIADVVAQTSAIIPRFPSRAEAVAWAEIERDAFFTLDRLKLAVVYR